ncbi:MAG TPA: universal stress protein [Thermoplasmata archaeon]|jgi:nucleotide-binding universal stress UspA family protein|nr:universal stress protein [Euryarchaeota archaeon]HIH00040.1 universal stress protein [Thermoplasmata archaeon]HIH29638.1 universal stress protein [Thermoplasmata archaeon]
MKRLLVAYDGSEASNKAIDVAVQCSTPDDELVLLTVIPAALVESTFTNMLLPTIDLSTVVTPGTFKEKAMENLGKLAKELEGKIGKVDVAVEAGDPADEILLVAKKYDSDIILIGYKGYGKEGRFLLGSVTDKVVRHASRSVLVVR